MGVVSHRRKRGRGRQRSWAPQRLLKIRAVERPELAGGEWSFNMNRLRGRGRRVERSAVFRKNVVDLARQCIFDREEFSLIAGRFEAADGFVGGRVNDLPGHAQIAAFALDLCDDNELRTRRPASACMSCTSFVAASPSTRDWCNVRVIQSGI